MVTVVLDPFDESSYDGSDMVSGATIDTPVLVGGGSVSDGSDASYVEMGTWVTSLGVNHLEPLSCDFVLPGTYANPTAIAIKLRMRSDPDIAADPPDLNPSSVPMTLHAVSDGTLLASVSSAGAVSNDVVAGSLTLVTERSFWFDDIDPDDPTDNGFWFEFAVDAGDPTACIDALTGDGIRAAIAVDAGGPLEAIPRRRPWLDIYEFQMLVACDAGVGFFPQRIYPRSDGLGIGPTRVYPPPPSHRVAGGYH